MRRTDAIGLAIVLLLALAGLITLMLIGGGNSCGAKCA